jgi:ABC-type multidrug transport system fused ATPase/permease subunit
VRELKRLLGYIKPYLAQIAAAAAMLAVAGGLMSMVVATLKPLVNEVLLAQRPAAAAAPETAGGIDLVAKIIEWLPAAELSAWLQREPTLKVPFLLVGLFLIRGLLLFFGEYLTTRTGASVIRDLRADLFASLMYQAPGFYREHPTGLVMSRLLNDVQRIQRVSTQVLADLVRVGAMAPAMLILVLLYDWRMTLFALLVLLGVLASACSGPAGDGLPGARSGALHPGPSFQPLPAGCRRRISRPSDSTSNAPAKPAP